MLAAGSNDISLCLVISGRSSLTLVVQKNGVVRMPNTRENPNGTFSSAKSWPVDKLEKFDHLGFIITIQKPYYWMTDTSKEKYSFMTGLVQVFRKFTGGKTPELVGFGSIFQQPGPQNGRKTPAPANPYAMAPSQTNPNPYAASHPQSKANPYTNSAPRDQYTAGSVAALKRQRHPSGPQEKRPSMERLPSRDGSRSKGSVELNANPGAIT